MHSKVTIVHIFNFAWYKSSIYNEEFKERKHLHVYVTFDLNLSRQGHERSGKCIPLNSEYRLITEWVTVQSALAF